MSRLLLAFWVCAGVVAAAPAEDLPPYKSEVIVGSRSGSGIYRFAPGRWNTVRTRLTNRTADGTVLQLRSYLPDQPALQFGRETWVPPHSIVELSYPFFTPDSTAAATDALELRTQSSVIGQGAEVLIRENSGKLEASDLFRISPRPSVTGVICTVGIPDDSREFDFVQELISTARRIGLLSIPVTEMTDPELPASAENWQAFDQVIVADRRIADDERALASLQQWIAAGGRAWVMLDQVAPDTLSILLGEQNQSSEVDRVGLNALTMDWHDPDGTHQKVNAEFEQPVQFVRTLPGDVDVLCSIDGWPAAWSLDYGSGQVLVTALGARAWLRDESGPKRRLFGKADTFAAEFLAVRPGKTALPVELDAVVQEYVGYAIPSRGLVTGLLAAFAGLLMLGALACWKLERLEWLGVFGPVTGLAFGGLLVGLGLQQRHSVAPTAARLQVIDVAPGGEDVRIRGTVGLYLPEGRTAQLGGTRGGRALPDFSGSGGAVHRLIWKDLDDWQWLNVSQPAGLRHLHYETSPRQNTRWAAAAEWNASGLAGQLQLPAGLVPEDAILIGPGGRTGVTMQSSGQFQAAAGSELSRGQFLQADVLSNEQRRRSRVVEQIVADGGNIDAPTLLFWTAPVDDGLQLGSDLTAVGSALIRAPLVLNRPAVGTEVRVPATLLSVREGRGPDGAVPQGIYDYRNRQWQERPGRTSTWLQYRLPPSLNPLALRELEVVARVSGPIGKLELSGWREGHLEPIHAWTAPVGTVSARIPDVSTLPTLPDGSFLLSVTAGEPVADPTGRFGDDRQYWRIESLALTVSGTTLPAVPVALPVP